MLVRTSKKLARIGSAKVYELIHGYRAPEYIRVGGQLSVRHFRDRFVKDLGIVSVNQVTNEFVEELVDNLIAEVAAFGDFKFHQSGIDATAEAATDTQATFNVTGCPAPVTGTQVENAANIYETVATVPYTGTLAITEHGVGNNSTWASAQLMDRSVFTAINVVNTDSIEFTYRLTCTAGG